ncbi:hypothetical protein ALC56_03008 [Trachymyrmex septentrionalis]|uniref:Uncharacterized protein n=1 Tax=Trachymyrmex septentrionalis TaxID=34720 RepID=A0A151K0K0_9HYME|nr:hypothetical protein ALC56_03008 [Trachymyrmex septentrionalis]
MMLSCMLRDARNERKDVIQHVVTRLKFLEKVWRAYLPSSIPEVLPYTPQFTRMQSVLRYPLVRTVKKKMYFAKESSVSFDVKNEYSTPQHRAMLLLSRRYDLTNTGYKFLEIGINVGPPSYVKIVLGDHRGHELLLSLETWMSLYEQRWNIYKMLRNEYKDNFIFPSARATKRKSHDEDAASAHKHERKEEEKEEQEEREEARETFDRYMTLHKSNDRSHNNVQPVTSTPRTKIVPTIESLENVFKTREDSLATEIQNQLQTSKDREVLQAGLGLLSQKYVVAVLKGARDKESELINAEHLSEFYDQASQLKPKKAKFKSEFLTILINFSEILEVQLKTRIAEHRNHIRHKTSARSVITDHRLSHNHDFQWDNVLILDEEPSYKKRLISEMLHIKKQKNSLNLQTDTEGLNKAYLPIINKRCLNDAIEMTHRQLCIRSKLHEVYTISEKKIALSPYNDKRYIVSDSTDTLT